MTRRRSVPLIVLVALLLVSAGSVVGIADTYSLSVPDSIETEPRTVTVDGEQYETNALAVVDPGETISVDVTAPAGTDARVELRTSDGQVEDIAQSTGSERVSIETDGADVGLYALGLYVDGEFEAIHPVVINGYDISVTHPETTATTEDVTVDLTVTEAAHDEPPDGVAVGVLADGFAERYTAEHHEGDRYQLTLASGTLEADEYKLYAVALGPDTVQGEQEPLGVSEQSSLTITDPETGETATPTPTPTPTDQTTTATQTPPSDQTETATPTPTSPTPTDTQPTPATATATDTATPTETSDGDVITPSTPGTDTPDTPAESLSVTFELLVAVGIISIAGAGLLVRNWR